MGVYLGSKSAQLTLAKGLDKRPLEALTALYQKKYSDRAAEIAEIKNNEELLGKKLARPYEVVNVNGSPVKNYFDNTPVNNKIGQVRSKIEEVKSKIGEELNKNPNANIDDYVSELQSHIGDIKNVSKQIDIQNEYVKSLDEVLEKHKGEIDGNFLGVNENTKNLISDPEGFSAPVSATKSSEDIGIRGILENALTRINNTSKEWYEDKNLDYDTYSLFREVAENKRSMKGLTQPELQKFIKKFQQMDPQVSQYLEKKAQAEHEGDVYEASQTPEGMIKMLSPISEKERMQLPVESAFEKTSTGDFITKDGKGFIDKKNYYISKNGSTYFDEKGYNAAVRSNGLPKQGLTGKDLMRVQRKEKTLGIGPAIASEFNYSTGIDKIMHKIPEPISGGGSGSESDPNGYVLATATALPYSVIKEKSPSMVFDPQKNVFQTSNNFIDQKTGQVRDMTFYQKMIDQLPDTPENKAAAHRYLSENFEKIKESGKGIFSMNTLRELGANMGFTAGQKQVFTKLYEDLTDGSTTTPKQAFDSLPKTQQQAIEDMHAQYRKDPRYKKVSDEELLKISIPQLITNQSDKAPNVLSSKKFNILQDGIEKALSGVSNYIVPGAGSGIREMDRTAGDSFDLSNVQTVENIGDKNFAVKVDVKKGDGTILRDVVVPIDIQQLGGVFDPRFQEIINTYNNYSAFTKHADGRQFQMPIFDEEKGGTVMGEFAVSGDNLYMVDSKGNRIELVGTRKSTARELDFVTNKK